MKPFDVYPLQPITLVKGRGSFLWDDKNEKYLDLYGGHAVISIGHSHPTYVNAIKEQIADLGFYSNSVLNSLQEEYALRLGKLSGYPDYALFMVNSGAEAIENALKLASFKNNKKTVISIKKGFHGRTSLALSVTDNDKIQAPINTVHSTQFIEMEDIAGLESTIAKNEICAVIIEGIQGIAGIYEPSNKFLEAIQALCKKYNALFILDEIQSGFGRSGKFFAHQYSNVKPDIITIAKGMGNGFPMGGVLINPELKPHYGMLGTTFGGSHLASAAGLAVLKVIEEEDLMQNSINVGTYLISALEELNVKEVRGKGLMLGIEFSFPIKAIRQELLEKYKILTGVAKNPNVLRILPALSISIDQAKYFISSLKSVIPNS